MPNDMGEMSMNMCGTYAPGVLEGEHPTAEEGEVDRTVYFNLGWDQEDWIHIKVINCNNDYFVYYLKEVIGCDVGYCGK